MSNNPFYNSSRHTLTGSKEPTETIAHPEQNLSSRIGQTAPLALAPSTAGPLAPQPSSSRTIELIKIEDDPEDVVAAPQVESVHSSDIEFIDTEGEDSIGLRGSMDDGDENSEGHKKQRENVIRCKIYRDKKKEEQLEGERQLERLLAENESAKMREAILDKSIAVLRQTYIKLVAKGQICGDCSSDEGETGGKEETE